jgi:hypothetical protein
MKIVTHKQLVFEYTIFTGEFLTTERIAWDGSNNQCNH